MRPLARQRFTRVCWRGIASSLRQATIAKIECAAEAYELRIQVGIHFPYDMVDRKEIGVKVAEKVISWEQADEEMVSKQTLY